MAATPRQRPGATIYSVAALAGVSIASVSRVLQGSTAVSDRTRVKVLAAAEQLELRAAGRRAQPRRPPARGARPGPSRAHRSLLLRAADGLRVPGGRARAERGPHARRRQGRPHPGGATARDPRRRPGDAGLRGDPRVRRPGAAGLQAAAAHRGRPPRGGRGDRRGEHRERSRPDAAPARPRPPPAAVRRRPRLRPGHPRPLPRLRAGPREPARSRRGRAGAHPVPRGRRQPVRGAHPRRRRRRRRARVRQRRARPVGHGAAAGGRQGRPRRHRRRRLGRRDDRPLRPPRPHHRPPARARARRDGRGPAARAGHRRLPPGRAPGPVHRAGAARLLWLPTRGHRAAYRLRAPATRTPSEPDPPALSPAGPCPHQKENHDETQPRDHGRDAGHRCPGPVRLRAEHRRRGLERPGQGRQQRQGQRHHHRVGDGRRGRQAPDAGQAVRERQPRRQGERHRDPVGRRARQVHHRHHGRQDP